MTRLRCSRSVTMLFSMALAAVAFPGPGPTFEDPNWVYEEVVSGLEAPVQLDFFPDGTALVIERTTGRVQHLDLNTRAFQTVLDLNVVANSLERGLVGLVTRPETDDGGPHVEVYLYWTENLNPNDSGGSIFANTLARFRWEGGAIDPDTREDLVFFPFAPGPIHLGGALVFLPDGSLVGTLGDLERVGRYQNRPDDGRQDRSGMIWRIDRDGNAPRDNPFVGADPVGVRGEDRITLQYWTDITFAYGFRNSYGIDVDPVTGHIWSTENGPIHWDEINLVTPGMNGGWAEIIGPPGQVPGDLGNLFELEGSEFRPPVFSWFTPIGITQIHFYRGTLLGEQYHLQPFIGGFNFGNLYHLRMNDGRDGFALEGPLADGMANNNPERELTVIGRGLGPVIDIDTGPDGFLYLTIYGTQGSGRIARIRPRGPGEIWSLY